MANCSIERVLLKDPWNLKEIINPRGRVPQQIVRVWLVRHHIVTHRRSGFADLGSRLDAAGIEFIEFIDVTQNLAHVRLETTLLIG